MQRARGKPRALLYTWYDFFMDTTRSQWLIPGAIVFAGLILALAIFSIRQTHILGAPPGDVLSMRAISPEEHIVGNPEAPVIIVEYADMDAPYAKEFQQTMSQLMTEYGAGGKVAWVYRHFPLVDQHPDSISHAEASECVASLGNTTAFWRFIDLLHAYAPGEMQFDPANYDSIVTQLGVSKADFDACLAQGKYTQKVEADFANALAIGAEGSPYSVLLVKGEKPAPISGSIPYGTLKQIVESAVGTSR